MRWSLSLAARVVFGLSAARGWRVEQIRRLDASGQAGEIALSPMDLNVIHFRDPRH